MITSFLTILYEDLLIGEQVDVQTTVHEGLLRGGQADVYSHRSSMSCCGTNRCNSYLRAVLDVFGMRTRRCSNFSRKRKATRSTREEGKVARRRTREK